MVVMAAQPGLTAAVTTKVSQPQSQDMNQKAKARSERPVSTCSVNKVLDLALDTASNGPGTSEAAINVVEDTPVDLVGDEVGDDLDLVTAIGPLERGSVNGSWFK